MRCSDSDSAFGRCVAASGSSIFETKSCHEKCRPFSPLPPKKNVSNRRRSCRNHCLCMVLHCISSKCVWGCLGLAFQFSGGMWSREDGVLCLVEDAGIRPRKRRRRKKGGRGPKCTFQAAVGKRAGSCSTSDNRDSPKRTRKGAYVGVQGWCFCGPKPEVGFCPGASLEKCVGWQGPSRKTKRMEVLKNPRGKIEASPLFAHPIFLSQMTFFLPRAVPEKEHHKPMCYHSASLRRVCYIAMTTSCKT